MLIRPPVVRKMRHDLWVKMTKTPETAAPTGQPVQSPFPGDSRIAQLKALGELRASGVLTEEEFAREKARILA